MIGLVFVKALSNKDVHERIRNVENVTSVKPIIHDQYNIMVFVDASNFMSLIKARNEINDFESVESTLHTVLFGPEWRPDAVAVLKDKKVLASLPRYFKVVQDLTPAKFLIAKKLAANFSEGDPTTKLWEIHSQLTPTFHLLQQDLDSQRNSLKRLKKLKKPKRSYLELKIEIAKRILEGCHLCTRKCNINRLDGKLGYCNCGDHITFSSVEQHWGEEADLVPAGSIFTMGCTMSCRHCANWRTSQWGRNGTVSSPKKMAGIVKRLKQDGSRNAFLTGEPTPWLHQWLETFKHVKINIPIVWNSNAYYSEETAKLLSGFVDLYLLDFKYGTNECAERISDAPTYWESCTRNYRYSKTFGELIIRVLILPEHHDCCTRARLNWIAKNLGTGLRTNLVQTFQPEWRAKEIQELKRRLTLEEMERTIKLAKDLGFTNLIT